MASDNRRDWAETFVPPPALLCQTSFLFPVRDFAMFITAQTPTPGLALFWQLHQLAPSSLLFAFSFLNQPSSGLNCHPVRRDTSHALFMKETAHVSAALPAILREYFGAYGSDNTCPSTVAGCRRRPCLSFKAVPSFHVTRRSSVPPPHLRQAAPRRAAGHLATGVTATLRLATYPATTGRHRQHRPVTTPAIPPLSLPGRPRSS